MGPVSGTRSLGDGRKGALPAVKQRGQDRCATTAVPVPKGRPRGPDGLLPGRTGRTASAATSVLSGCLRHSRGPAGLTKTTRLRDRQRSAESWSCSWASTGQTGRASPCPSPSPATEHRHAPSRTSLRVARDGCVCGPARARTLSSVFPGLGGRLLEAPRTLTRRGPRPPLWAAIFLPLARPRPAAFAPPTGWELTLGAGLAGRGKFLDQATPTGGAKSGQPGAPSFRFQL